MTGVNRLVLGDHLMRKRRWSPVSRPVLEAREGVGRSGSLSVGRLRTLISRDASHEGLASRLRVADSGNCPAAAPARQIYHGRLGVLMAHREHEPHALGGSEIGELE
jgi:hypothetical protein